MNAKKIVLFIIELLVSPFTLLYRTANVIPNPNKVVKVLLMFGISLAVVVALILYVYREVIFRWWIT